MEELFQKLAPMVELYNATRPNADIDAMRGMQNLQQDARTEQYANQLGYPSAASVAVSNSLADRGVREEERKALSEGREARVRELKLHPLYTAIGAAQEAGDWNEVKRLTQELFGRAELGIDSQLVPPSYLTPEKPKTNATDAQKTKAAKLL
jgi:hypothetical protein